MQSGRAFALEITLQRPKPARRTTRATPSATATFDGARTFMHLPSFKLQQSQHLLHIAFRCSESQSFCQLCRQKIADRTCRML